MKSRIIKEPKKAADMLEEIKQNMTGGKLKVGLPKDSQPYPDGTPVQLVGHVHEFGSENRNIPERSFLRSTLDENKKNYLKDMRGFAKLIIRGKISGKKALQIMGLKMSSDVKQKIVDISTPPNDPATIKGKGSSNPLIDTNHMRDSVTWIVEDAN